MSKLQIPIMADCVLGLDMSLAAPAIALGKQSGERYAQTLATKFEGDDVAARVARCNRIIEPIDKVVREHNIALAVIEAYPYAGGKFAGKAHDRAELGGMLRWTLVNRGVCCVEVFPNTLKVFAAEYGAAEKLDVIKALEKRYRVHFRNDNEADAFALMTLGQCVIGHSVACSVKQQKTVQQCRLRWGLQRFEQRGALSA